MKAEDAIFVSKIQFESQDMPPIWIYFWFDSRSDVVDYSFLQYNSSEWMDGKIWSMFDRFWWAHCCHQWIFLYFYFSNFAYHHGTSLLVSTFWWRILHESSCMTHSARAMSYDLDDSCGMIHFYFSALGTFALLAETSFLCVCLMDKEWYRNFLERVNFGHFRKAIFYTV